MSGKVEFAYIDAAVPPSEYTGSDAYDNAGTYFCKVLVGHARRDPIAFREALDAYRADVFTNAIEALLTPEEVDICIKGEWGLTGFQFGWAVQTAAWLLEQAPVGNPAILTIRPTVTP